STMAWTGVATKVTSALRSSPTASRAPSSNARAARLESRSRPVTYQPRARSARPSEPPISPVPTIAAWLVLASPGEVVTEPLGVDLERGRAAQRPHCRTGHGSNLLLAARRLLERLDFARRERPPLTRLQPAIDERANPGADKTDDRVTDRRAHASHLILPPLV